MNDQYGVEIQTEKYYRPYCRLCGWTGNVRTTSEEFIADIDVEQVANEELLTHLNNHPAQLGDDLEATVI